MDSCQPMQGISDEGVFTTKNLLCSLQSPLIERQCLGIAGPFSQIASDVIHQKQEVALLFLAVSFFSKKSLGMRQQALAYLPVVGHDIFSGEQTGQRDQGPALPVLPIG